MIKNGDNCANVWLAHLYKGTATCIGGRFNTAVQKRLIIRWLGNNMTSTVAKYRECSDILKGHSFSLLLCDLNIID